MSVQDCKGRVPSADAAGPQPIADAFTDVPDTDAEAAATGEVDADDMSVQGGE